MLMFTILIGCGSTTSGGQQEGKWSIEKVKKEYQKIAKKLAKVPDDLSEKIKIPSYIPFEVKRVTLYVTGGPFGHNEKVTDSGWSFYGKDITALHVHTLFNINSVQGTSDKKVKLENGIVATYIHSNDHSVGIRWLDEHTSYNLLLMDREGKYGKKDIIKIANSMY